jgi:hypothetical protein
MALRALACSGLKSEDPSKVLSPQPLLKPPEYLPVILKIYISVHGKEGSC